MEYLDRQQQQLIDATVFSESFVDDAVKVTGSVYYWAYKNLNAELYNNQLEIVKAVINPDVKNLAVLQARGAGKTYAVCVGLVRLALDTPGLKIGIFAPKAENASRLIEEITERIATPYTKLYSEFDWERSTKSRLFFKNGSEMTTMSAAPTTQQEGWHFHVLVIDECHRIEDAVVNQRLNPMLGSFEMAKTIKIGIPAAKNNFWKSCQSKNYTVLKRSWLECDILLKPGSFFYNGIWYPQHIVEKLALTVKQKLFPDRPDLHYDGEYGWIEFKTQFAMEWVDDIWLELSSENQARLASGNHEILKKGRPTLQEHYYFGLDTAQGSLQPGKKDLDFTALSIWRKRGDDVKEKVACYEWQGDVVTQWEEIKAIIHPITGIFKCDFGIADHSNIAHSLVPFFQKEKIPITSLLFGHQDPDSKKNYKNAMFDEFRLALESDKIKFPSIDTMDKDKVFKKSYNEWCNIERHVAKGLGINDKIEAPSDLHDDHCCADVLAVWAMNKTAQFPSARNMTYKLPKPQIGSTNSVQSRIMGAGVNRQENRYLK